MLTSDEMFVRTFRGQGNVLGATVQFCTPVVVGFVPDEVGWPPAGRRGSSGTKVSGRSPRWAHFAAVLKRNDAPVNDTLAGW